MSVVRPGRFWLMTLAAILGVAAGLALGFWQLSRAAQRNERQAMVEARRQSPALDGASLVAAASGAAQAVWRPVRLRGEWVPQHTVYLDNRQMRGRVGFDVLTPLRLEGTGRVVMVQRGWIARDFTQRERLPAVQTPAGVVRLDGRIAPPPPKLYQFSDSGRGPIRQNLDLAVFQADTGLPMLTSLSVQQSGAPSEGLLREWTEAGSGAERNYGYAFQWFALSGLIAILYVWFQFIAPRRRS